jgi:acylphosphatase
MRRVSLVIRGRVQGVSYRANTAREAGRLGLTGWVRNRADGSVAVEAQGTPAQVDALIAWCHAGPPAAVVTSVEVIELPTRSDDDGFDIAW